jgi:enoyl-CoA hydratase
MTPEPGSAGLVTLDVRDQVATVTLDSPHNRNALSRRLVAELSAHLRTSGERSDVRVVVVTHTGNTFCAGADLAEAAELGMEQATRSLLDLLRLVVELPPPVLAVVKGHVRAGGMGLVGACDLALGTDTSTFAFTEALLGLAPAVISLTTRGRLTPRDAGRKYLTGSTFDGAEAARCGLLTSAVPQDGLDAATGSLVSELLRASPQGLRETKRLLNASLLKRIDDDGDQLVELSARLFASGEAREGMSAFRERRLPAWVAAASFDRPHPAGAEPHE